MAHTSDAGLKMPGALASSDQDEVCESFHYILPYSGLTFDGSVSGLGIGNFLLNSSIRPSTRCSSREVPNAIVIKD